jgi:hypothetical protein
MQNDTNKTQTVDLIAVLKASAKYIYFQDLGDALIGPFFSQAEIDAHIAFCAKRGDAAEVVGIYEAGSDEYKKLIAANVDVYTAAEDRAQSVDDWDWKAEHDRDLEQESRDDYDQDHSD